MPTIIHRTGRGKVAQKQIGSKPLLVVAGLDRELRTPTSGDIVASEVNRLINTNRTLVDSGLTGDIVVAGHGPVALQNLANLADPLAETKILESYLLKSDAVDPVTFGSFCDAVSSMDAKQSPAETKKALVTLGFSRSPFDMYGQAREAVTKQNLVRRIAKNHKPGGTAAQAIQTTLDEVTAEVAARRQVLAALVNSRKQTFDQLAVFQRISGASCLPLIAGTGELTIEDFLATEGAALEAMIAEHGVDDVVLVGESVNDLAVAEEVTSHGDRPFHLWVEVSTDAATAVSQLGRLDENECHSRIIACIGNGNGTAAVALFAHRLVQDGELVIQNNPSEDRLGLFEPQEAQPIFGLTGKEPFVLDIPKMQQEALSKAGLNGLVKSKSGVRATPLVTRCARADLHDGVPVRGSGIVQSFVADELGELWHGKYLYQQQLDAGVDAAMRVFAPYNTSKMIEIKAKAERGLNPGQVLFSVAFGVPNKIKVIVLRRVININ